MEFEEMQAIWNSETNEKMYVVSEEVLNRQVREKSESAQGKVRWWESLFTYINFFGALLLAVMFWINGNLGTWSYLLPALYFVYAIVGLVLQRRRIKAQPQFPSTVLGEVDKALWQVDQLIERGQSTFYWYTLPLLIALAVFVYITTGLSWFMAGIVLLSLISWFSQNYEVNHWYMPRKVELEKLRATLLQEPQ